MRRKLHYTQNLTQQSTLTHGKHDFIYFMVRHGAYTTHHLLTIPQYFQCQLMHTIAVLTQQTVAVTHTQFY